MDSRNAIKEPDKVIKFLKILKKKSRSYPTYSEDLSKLQEEAVSEGLDETELNLLFSVIKKLHLGSNNPVELAKCMIPQNKLSDNRVHDMISWFISMLSLNKLPIKVSITFVQWIIGSCENQIIKRNLLYCYYEILFHQLLKQSKVEVVLA